ncbi:hypothetical protein L7F22_031308, partial [Adiantum nelumboides]|nr:hypothetical protein [Adiantum nelumboides]
APPRPFKGRALWLSTNKALHEALRNGLLPGSIPMYQSSSPLANLLTLTKTRPQYTNMQQLSSHVGTSSNGGKSSKIVAFGLEQGIAFPPLNPPLPSSTYGASVRGGLEDLVRPSSPMFSGIHQFNHSILNPMWSHEGNDMLPAPGTNPKSAEGMNHFNPRQQGSIPPFLEPDHRKSDDLNTHLGTSSQAGPSNKAKTEGSYLVKSFRPSWNFITTKASLPAAFCHDWQLMLQDSIWTGHLSVKCKISPTRRTHLCFKKGIRKWGDLAVQGRWKYWQELQEEFGIPEPTAKWIINNCNLPI